MSKQGRPPVRREAIRQFVEQEARGRLVVPSPEAATQALGGDGGNVRRAYRALLAAGALAYDEEARVYYLPES